MTDKNSDALSTTASVGTPASGSLLLLCSDGLWNYCSQADVLSRQMKSGGDDASLVQRCSRLIDFGNAAGGQDNITVALYRHAEH